jgi:hypothetical protein
VLSLIKPKQQQQQPDQENLDQPVIKVCGRKSQAEKPSLHQVLQQMIAATPGYEDSSLEELAAISEGLLEFASIAYSIFLKEQPLENEEPEPGVDSSFEDPTIFKETDVMPEITTLTNTKSNSTL